MKLKKIILLVLFILFSSVSCSFFQNEEDKEYVFIVEDYYHKISCISMLGNTGIPMLKEIAEKQGYKPCSACNP